MTQTPNSLLIELLTKEIKKRSDDMPILVTVAPVKLTIRRKDGTYRVQKVAGGEEFLLVGAREGKRKGVIMELAPAGSSDIHIVEIPTMSDQLSKIVGLESLISDLLGQPGRTWRNASRYAVKKLREEEDQRKKEEFEQRAEANKNNPNWGMF